MSQKKPSQFRSNYRAMRITARHGHKVYHPVTGTEIRDQEVKELTAEFGVHRGEYKVTDDDGNELGTYADIAGNFYDLDVDAEAKGWSAEEKEAMREHLIRKSVELPDFCQIHSIPAAPAPWPSYDDVPAENVGLLAIDLGLAEGALAYERENLNRPEVRTVLEVHIQGSVPAEAEELTAA